MSDRRQCNVEVTTGGYLLLEAPVAREFFPNDTLLVIPSARELWLLPTRGAAAGGMLLKQRNPAGDRSVLVREVLHDDLPAGRLPAFWDENQGALRVALLASAAIPDSF